MTQQTLFDMKQPKLAMSGRRLRGMRMVIEDQATSNDPLEIHLQRRGWCLNRVRELQESISEKLTVDMFTGRTESLSALELQLQSDIQEFLNKQKG